MYETAIKKDMNYRKCKGCKGCMEFMDHTLCVGSKIVDGITVTCPCQTCLIKMVCKKGCEEFKEYNR